MVDLIDYWINLPSSIDISDPEKNFNFAVTRAKWIAQQFLHQRFDELRRERPGLGRNHLNEEDGGVEVSFELADDTPTPEETACDDAEFQQIREFLAQLPAEHLRGWLQGFVEGVPVCEQARSEGVSHVAVSKRRKRGIERLRIAAADFGLLGSNNDERATSPISEASADV